MLRPSLSARFMLLMRFLSSGGISLFGWVHLLEAAVATERLTGCRARLMVASQHADTHVPRIYVMADNNHWQRVIKGKPTRSGRLAITRLSHNSPERRRHQSSTHLELHPFHNKCQARPPHLRLLPPAWLKRLNWNPPRYVWWSACSGNQSFGEGLGSWHPPWPRLNPRE